MSKIYFIIGVNGIGKSTLLPHLKSNLSDKNFVVHDFDERGVPDNVDSEWRRSETKYWLEIGKQNISRNISTIICGFSKPEEIKSASESLQADVSVLLLDAAPETITKRILGRYLTPESREELERTVRKTPEKFASDNVWVSSRFREESQRLGYRILDTSVMSPEAVAQEVIDWINLVPDIQQ